MYYIDNIPIRLATLLDIPAIMNIISLNIPIMHSNDNFQWDDTYPLAHHFENDIQNECLYVIEIENEMKAFGALTTTPCEEYSDAGLDMSIPSIIPHRIACHPNEQGKGYVICLFKFSEILAKQKGFDRIRIDTNCKNTRMQKLLQYLNYSFCGEISLRDTNELLKFQCYEKILTSIWLVH